LPTAQSESESFSEKTYVEGECVSDFGGVRRALEHRRLTLANRNYQPNLQSVVETRTEQLRKATVDLERSYDVTLDARRVPSNELTATGH
jgi:hypothetical protein